MHFLHFPNRNIYIIVLSFAVMGFASCIKDRIDMNKVSSSVNWNPKLGAPLAYGSLSLKDIIESRDSGGVIKAYPDGLLYLAYRNSLLPYEIKNATNLISIPDQNYPVTFAQNLFSVIIPGSDTISLKQSQTYNLKVNNSEEIDSLFFKSGDIILTIQSTFHYIGIAKVILPSLIKDGTAFSQLVPIDKADGTFNVTLTSDIKDYKLITKIGGVPNRIPINFEIALVNKKQPISGQVTINVSLKKITFRSLFGYLGKYEALNISDVLKLNIFGNTSNLNVIFADPRIRLYSANSFGTPLQIVLNKVKTSDINTTTFFDLALAPSVKTFDFRYPVQVGKSAFDTIRIDKTNSNLDLAIATNPAYLFYNMVCTVNPKGKLPNVTNFVTDTSHLDVDFELELPMYLKAGKYEMRDTLNMKIDSIIGDVSMIDKLLIHGIFSNYMPFDVKLEVILTDDKFVHIDTLFLSNQQPIIKSGEIDLKGLVSKPGMNIIDIVYDNTRIKPLQKVKHALVKAIVNTANNGQAFVKFYSQYRLDVSLGFQTELKIKSLKQF